MAKNREELANAEMDANEDKPVVIYEPQFLVDPIQVELGEAHCLEIRANHVVHSTIQL